MFWYTKKRQSFVCLIERLNIVQYIFVAAAFFPAATSCVKVVTMDALEEPQVVVECILCDEPVQTLNLTYTKGASRESAPELSEAEASLTDLTEGKEVGLFTRSADGSWKLDYAAIPSHNYRLEVNIPGHESISAEQTMPENPGIEVGWHEFDPNWHKENPDKILFDYVGYEFRFTHANNHPVWFYGVNYKDADSSGEETQYLYTDSPLVDTFNETENRFGAAGYDGYIWGERNNPYLMAGCYPVMAGAPQHTRYLRFPAREGPPGSKFLISGSFQGYISDSKDFIHADLRPAELHYMSVSEDYDRFLKDSEHIRSIKTSTDLSSIFLRDNVYSNIQGAIGIFGARIERMMEWEGRDTWQKSGYFLLGSFLPGTQPHLYKGVIYSSYREIDTRFLSSRPFELIHFEYWRLAYNESEPDWTPILTTDSDGITRNFYWETIESQSQLESSGLGDCGQIDFSKKKVLLCAIRFIDEVPVMIGFGHGADPFGGDEFWPTGKYGPMLFTHYTHYWDEKSDSHYIHPEHPVCPFRFALLIDKDEPIPFSSEILYDFQFVVRLNNNNNESALERLVRMAEAFAWNR